ncbi:MAG: AAA domain-containing protein [Dehalobacter sp.]|nr:AAA domain-containing protein [Dehalobacter sp.]
MKNTEKIVALYKYIAQLCALKYRVVKDVDKQYWTRYLKDIPDAPEYISIYYRDRVEEETSDDTVLLAVKKPDFQRCPEPHDVISEWLEPGWDHFSNEVKIKNTLSQNDENSDNKEYQSEKFSDSKQRISVFESWNARRDIWVGKQRVIDKTRKFFAQLFELYTDLERESETLEIMVGNGIVKEVGNNAINHPILLKPVKLQFDAEKNIISIHDTVTEPELYTLLFQEMREINHGAVKQLQETLRENYYHPLDRNDSPDFLKILTHRLCPDSHFITDEQDKICNSDKIITTLNPVFFARKRIDGTLKTIEEIIKTIEGTGRVPGHLIDLVDGGLIEIPENENEPTIEEQLAAISGESISILLSKEANREQLEIAERIEHYNAVLVQGPPGTGKTHTIANLLGHFLAQGKSVLVTSHTKKALSVLKEKLPNEIKDLCVSVLDDTNLDMVRSIDGITEYMSRHTANELKRQDETDSRQRASIMQQLAEVRKKIFTIKHKEFEPIVYNGDSYSPAEVAAFVNANAAELSYIPGKVKLSHPLPVTVEQLIMLYHSNVGITESEEKELACSIPAIDVLLSPSSFENDLLSSEKCKSRIDEISKELNLNIDINLDKKSIHRNGGSPANPFVQNPSAERLEQLSHYVNSFKDIDGWMIHAAVDGNKGGGYRQRWDKLINAIKDTAAYADSIVAEMLGRHFEIMPEAISVQLSSHLQKIIEIFQKKGKITKFDLLFNKSLEMVLTSIKINGLPISSENDCRLIQNYLELQEKRSQTALLWNELIAKHDMIEFSSLDDEPERIGLRMIPNIKRYLDWYQEEYSNLMQFVNQAGLFADAIFCESEMDSELMRTEKMLNKVQKELPLYIEFANLLITLCNIEERKRQMIQSLSEGKRKNSPTCNSLKESITSCNHESYTKYYQQLSELYNKYALKSLREEMLELIEPIAPEWTDEIRNRVGIHGELTCPPSIADAWKWKQFAGIIDSITAEPFEELQHKSVMLSRELQRITAKVAASRAWYNLMLRTERNLSMRQALQGWKLTVKKIGKGTGKNAPALRKQARELMVECQVAVPAWIMTVNKAMESLNPANNNFDVVIIDEASQSDISALCIMYMAKKVIIVGDDKQVSPMAVGVDVDKMNALRDMHIKDIIPAAHLYDAKTSLYDIAGTTFQPLMLREHFRCLPDIIGYSNKLSYDFKIKPLRDASSTQISPPMVNFRVDGGIREGRQKINIKEAETIVALLMACLEQKEYEYLTFGVISLLGNEQSEKIQQIILKRIDPVIIEQRRILCGDASHFQGDERDVVFLSLVDSNEGDGPLSMAGEGADQSRKQRYNVAASRAKDQLWVVHSLDYSRDLKSGDLRRDLLEYAENPKAFIQLAEKVKAKAESPFEEAVGKSLVASGYHLIQQKDVGAYRIDMVVQYKDKSIAVECDGESFHSGDEKVREDMERQAILERIGWKFIRIRGSEYYRNPEGTMERVKLELTRNGILPETILEESVSQEKSLLLDNVKIRAAQILDEWHSEKGDELNEIRFEPVITQPLKQETMMPAEKENRTIQPVGNVPDLSLVQKQIIKKSEKPYEKPTSSTIHSTAKTNNQMNIRTEKLKISSKGNFLINSFKNAGISYIDNRMQSGIIWVPLINSEKMKIEKIINESGLRFSFEGRGSKATENKPAWRIMAD